MFTCMSADAQAVLEKFIKLPRAEQLSVYEAIARTVGPQDYGPLSDNELTAIAAQTFALLDEEETRAHTR
ncbi:MAG: hypothetical protein ABSF95_13300 [Verrucomicrobiota bacterium]